MKKLVFAITAMLLLASCTGKKSDVDVITNFYNAALGKAEMTDALLKKSLSEDLLSALWEADYENTYSWWKLRTGYQDGISEDSSLESVEALGEGWYQVSYTDMGIKAVTDVKMTDGKISEYRPFRVPFRYAKGYFVRNDVEDGEYPSKITSLGEFEKYFGMATVMGENGKPTEIDFNKDFVIPVIYPETDQETSVVVERLWHTAPAELTLSVGTIRGQEHRSFKIRPVVILLVDNGYSDYQINVSLQ